VQLFELSCKLSSKIIQNQHQFLDKLLIDYLLITIVELIIKNSLSPSHYNQSLLKEIKNEKAMSIYTFTLTSEVSTIKIITLLADLNLLHNMLYQQNQFEDTVAV